MSGRAPRSTPSLGKRRCLCLLRPVTQSISRCCQNCALTALLTSIPGAGAGSPGALQGWLPPELAGNRCTELGNLLRCLGGPWGVLPGASEFPREPPRQLLAEGMLCPPWSRWHRGGGGKPAPLRTLSRLPGEVGWGREDGVTVGGKQGSEKALFLLLRRCSPEELALCFVGGGCRLALPSCHLDCRNPCAWGAA